MPKQLLQSLSFVQHSTVNDTLDFVNPTTGGHTQHTCGKLLWESEEQIQINERSPC